MLILLVIGIIFWLIPKFIKGNPKRKKIVFIVFISVILLSFMIQAGYFLIYKNNFKNSIYVVTKDESNGNINYYEINDRDYKRTIKKFELEENEIVYLQECFDSYIDREAREVLNRLKEECRVIDSYENEIEKDETTTDIINSISKLVHAIWGEPKIFKVNNNYYVEVAFNVNWWSPYELYKYENNKLISLYTFNGQSIVAIKEK